MRSRRRAFLLVAAVFSASGSLAALVAEDDDTGDAAFDEDDSDLDDPDENDCDCGEEGGPEETPGWTDLTKAVEGFESGRSSASLRNPSKSAKEAAKEDDDHVKILQLEALERIRAKNRRCEAGVLEENATTGGDEDVKRQGDKAKQRAKNAIEMSRRASSNIKNARKLKCASMEMDDKVAKLKGEKDDAEKKMASLVQEVEESTETACCLHDRAIKAFTDETAEVEETHKKFEAANCEASSTVQEKMDAVKEAQKARSCGCPTAESTKKVANALTAAKEAMMNAITVKREEKKVGKEIHAVLNRGKAKKEKIEAKGNSEITADDMQKQINGLMKPVCMLEESDDSPEAVLHQPRSEDDSEPQPGAGENEDADSSPIKLL